MTGTAYLWAMTITMMAVTFLLRAFPFLLFSRQKKCPQIITYLGQVLSPAAIAMLVVYCIVCRYDGRSLSDGHYGLPEAAAIAATVIIHWFVKNPLISIISGTALYMLLL